MKVDHAPPFRLSGLELTLAVDDDAIALLALSNYETLAKQPKMITKNCVASWYYRLLFWYGAGH